MKYKQYDFRTGFIDLLLCCFSTLVLLFILSTLLINPTRKVTQEGLKKNAEFIIQLEWDPKINCDVDLWVKNPSNTTVSFKLKDSDLMNLERDDFGHLNDTLFIDGKQVIIEKNSEIITVRALMPGPYVVNVQLYACGELPVGEQKALPVKVSLTKLNPTVVLLNERIVEFKQIFEEKTAFSFEVDNSGNVKNFDYAYKKLINFETRVTR